MHKNLSTKKNVTMSDMDLKVNKLILNYKEIFYNFIMYVKVFYNKIGIN